MASHSDFPSRPELPTVSKAINITLVNITFTSQTVQNTGQNIVGTLTLEIERTKIFYYDFTNYTLLRVDTHSNISKFKRLPPVSGTETDN
jgi:hypothetical protein